MLGDKIIKLLEVYIFVTCTGQQLLTYDPKSTHDQKKKTDKLGFIRIESYFASKDIIKNESPLNGRKYLQIIYLIRIKYSKYVKNLYNSIIKR